jgi:hypothetical protein
MSYVLMLLVVGTNWSWQGPVAVYPTQQACMAAKARLQKQSPESHFKCWPTKTGRRGK